MQGKALSSEDSGSHGATGGELRLGASLYSQFVFFMLAEVVPEVFPHLCGRRVLVMEFALASKDALEHGS